MRLPPSSMAPRSGASSFSTRSVGALPHTMGCPSPGRSLSTYTKKLVRRRSLPPTITSLTQLGDLLPGVVNMNVSVREVGEEIVFLRRLEEGGADRSY